MGRYVLMVDVSGSMRCKLKKLKETLSEDWLPWRMGSPAVNQVALIAFSNEVCIKSGYTTDLAMLQGMVNSLTLGGCGGQLTSLYDAIIVATVFESPKPDEIYIWSDLQDTNSNATESDYINLGNSVGVHYNFCPPYPWMEDPNCPYLAVWTTVPFRPIAFNQSIVLATAAAKKLKRANVIEKPELLLKTAIT